MDRDWNGIMFDDIGVKIQKVAKVFTWLGILASIVYGFVLFFMGIAEFEYSGYLVFLAPLVAVVGCFASWLSSIMLYGFGKLIEDVGEIRNQKDENEQGRTVYGNANYAYQQNTTYGQNANQEQKTTADEIIDKENLDDDDFVDVYCPNCWEKLSFFKEEENTYCPNCNTKINIK